MLPTGQGFYPGDVACVVRLISGKIWLKFLIDKCCIHTAGQIGWQAAIALQLFGQSACRDLRTSGSLQTLEVGSALQWDHHWRDD